MRDVRKVAARLHVLHAAHPGCGLDDLAREVLALAPGATLGREDALLSEIESLGQAIETMRQEVARLPVDDIASNHIPCATDELDAIVEHTAAATDTILESCEALDTLAGSLEPAPSRTVQEMTTRIYEACSFQDITGQRIAKIVATLKAIEGKVAHIRDAFGGCDAETAAEDGEAGLLNGPQLPADAMAQADIDRLLATF